MFTLEIPLTAHAVDSLKADLRAAWPEVKSSHRAEALARGLGFRTNAALLSALKVHEPQTIRPNAPALLGYLAEHDFEGDPKSLYRSMARVAVRAAMAQEPKLAWTGIGVGQPRLKSDGRRETPTESYSGWKRRRRELLDDHNLDQFLRALVFLAKVTPTKTIRGDTDSYRLKHVAENLACTWPEGDELGPDYVANGNLIAAAIHLGFRYRKVFDDYGYDWPNVTFNMSQRCLEDLDCAIRPHGSRAETRRRLAENKRYGWPYR